MPLTRTAADAFGVVTISLVSLTVILGLRCIYHSVYFQVRIRRSGLLQLSYFNGPWVTRITLILISIWWGVGEIARLSFLRGRGRLFSDIAWQKIFCKFYILSNLGFAEPGMFLMLVFLLHASLRRRESGTLSPRWNRRTVGHVLILCIPIFIMQLALVIFGPKLENEERGTKRTKMVKFFTSDSSLSGEISVCTYPLVSTILVGLFDALLITYVSYIGTRMLLLVINKGLRLRVYLLTFSIIIFLPLRVLLLGFSVLPRPGNLVFEAIVFLAFLMLLFCTVVGICMLVYFPVADSLAVGDSGHILLEESPYDDYYHDSSLIANQSRQEMTGRNSDAFTRHSSISFQAMISDEPSAPGSIGDSTFFSSSSLEIVSRERSS